MPSRQAGANGIDAKRQTPQMPPLIEAIKPVWREITESNRTYNPVDELRRLKVISGKDDQVFAKSLEGIPKEHWTDYADFLLSFARKRLAQDHIINANQKTPEEELLENNPLDIKRLSDDFKRIFEEIPAGHHDRFFGGGLKRLIKAGGLKTQDERDGFIESLNMLLPERRAPYVTDILANQKENETKKDKDKPEKIGLKRGNDYKETAEAVAGLERNTPPSLKAKDGLIPHIGHAVAKGHIQLAPELRAYAASFDLIEDKEHIPEFAGFTQHLRTNDIGGFTGQDGMAVAARGFNDYMNSIPAGKRDVEDMVGGLRKLTSVGIGVGPQLLNRELGWRALRAAIDAVPDKDKDSFIGFYVSNMLTNLNVRIQDAAEAFREHEMKVKATQERTQRDFAEYEKWSKLPFWKRMVTRKPRV